MNIGNLIGLVTLVLMVLFIGIVVWAYSKRRREDFDAAARLPLDDDTEYEKRTPPEASEK
ncbi:MAG: cbb3-type cytochrome c oxidase subunit 3 [Pseudomonadota bacterium]|nr:cbb3-type cytochrome c oxidase subunit 3 [Pseudomonadota bacterium]